MTAERGKSYRAWGRKDLWSNVPLPSATTLWLFVDTLSWWHLNRKERETKREEERMSFMMDERLSCYVWKEYSCYSDELLSTDKQVGYISDGCLTGSGLVFTLQSQNRNHSHVEHEGRHRPNKRHKWGLASAET